MKRWTILTVFFNSGLAIAASTHSNEIPSVTVWQFINLAIMFSALIYLLKDGVKKQFADKKTSFLAEAEKSRQIQHEAERSYLEIKKKLEEFNKTVESSLARARKDARELGLQMINDANNQALKIKEEARLTAENESQRAQRRLHDQVVSEVIGMARSVLSKDIGSSDHQKLQSDFSKNIQTVSP